MNKNLQNWLIKNCDEIPEIDLVQPADPFIESAGADMQQKIFLAQNTLGQNNSQLKCIRPEFTIPICLYHIKNKNKAKRYGYNGTVLRQVVGKAANDVSQFQQIGIEYLGHKNSAKLDAKSIADMIAVLKLTKNTNYKLIIGDKNLFSSIINSLAIPQRLSQRIERNFGNDKLLAQQIKMLAIKKQITTKSLPEFKTLLEKIEKQFNKAQLSPRTGRTPFDIATRLMEKTNDETFCLPKTHAHILKKFLTIKIPLSKAKQVLENFSKTENINFGTALDEFCVRLDELQKQKIDLTKFIFQSSFGRKIDYYTGLSFEARRSDKVLAGGGRYDKLCTLLGAKVKINAIGFSLNLKKENTK